LVAGSWLGQWHWRWAAENMGPNVMKG